MRTRRQCSNAMCTAYNGRSKISGEGRRQPIIWQMFRQKLHENERNWPKRGGAQPWRPMDPPMGFTAKGNYQSFNILAKLHVIMISKVRRPLNGTRTPVTDRLSTPKQSLRCIATESPSTRLPDPGLRSKILENLSRLNFLHFHAVFSNIWLNNGFPLGIGPYGNPGSSPDFNS